MDDLARIDGFELLCRSPRDIGWHGPLGYCARCDQAVVDFSAMTANEAIAARQAYAGRPLCAKVSVSNGRVQHRAPRRHLRTMTLAIGLGVGGLALASCAVSPEPEPQPPQVSDTVAPDAPTSTVVAPVPVETALDEPLTGVVRLLENINLAIADVAAMYGPAIPDPRGDGPYPLAEVQARHAMTPAEKKAEALAEPDRRVKRGHTRRFIGMIDTDGRF